jgi:aspartate ammonia-lyase
MIRKEQDSLGAREVPAASLFGVQTLRAMENFPITGKTIGSWPHFVKAFATVKRSCATANLRCGRFEQTKHDAIVAACDELIDARHLEQFPVDVLQGGAGTSTNMNFNEVIANLALEKLGYERGRYDVIHPNDDVNKSQSTNDIYPTAVRFACLQINEELGAALGHLTRCFEQKATEFATIPKLARTQMQDAIPMTLGQEFSAFATVIAEDVVYLGRLAENFLEINLGGTAIGTGLNAPDGYAEFAIRELRQQTGYPFRAASNLVEATWDCGAFVLYSGMLKRTSTKLSKIANDLRLLSSGPRDGFGEIRLPERQPGSSIMPGKVNPVIPEVVNQVAFAVIGNDVTITLAAEAGQLQLNAMVPVLVHKTFESVSWLTSAILVFADFCVSGIEANVETCKRHLNAGTALVTALVPSLGYEAAAEIADLMIVHNLSLEDALTKSTSDPSN